MAIEIVDCPIKNGGSFHSYVSLPEGSNNAFFSPWCWYIDLQLGDFVWANVGNYSSSMEHLVLINH